MTEPIFHITAHAAWTAAQKAGKYSAPSLTADGFIHCSTRAQVLSVAEKFYRDQRGLVLLLIDPAQLTSDLKWEPADEGTPPPGVPAGDLFPHIYGPLNLGAVTQALDFELNPDGNFSFPSLPAAE